MGMPDDCVDIFLPGGHLRQDLMDDSAWNVLHESVRLARETYWESIRSPHVFMGLLAMPDAGVYAWAERLQADLDILLGQFQILFRREENQEETYLALNREFLSDNVIRLLRDAHQRAHDHHRAHITTMDLLISLFTAPHSIVAECFQSIGVTAARLTELAVMAENDQRRQ